MIHCVLQLFLLQLVVEIIVYICVLFEVHWGGEISFFPFFSSFLCFVEVFKTLG